MGIELVEHLLQIQLMHLSNLTSVCGPEDQGFETLWGAKFSAPCPDRPCDPAQLPAQVVPEFSRV